MWRCKRCETINDDESAHCVVCDGTKIEWRMDECKEVQRRDEQKTDSNVPVREMNHAVRWDAAEPVEGSVRKTRREWYEEERRKIRERREKKKKKRIL